LLAEAGPGLGRPLVDTIHGSSIANLKELRPGTVRILFASTRWRASILLVAGTRPDNGTSGTPKPSPWPSTVRDLTERTRRGGGPQAMSSNTRWRDIRAEHVERVGGEQAVEDDKHELLATVVGHRLAEVRRTRGLTQQQVADRMGVTKGRVSQIEQGKISGQDVLARYAAALGGRLHQVIYFDDGNLAAIA
jgi:DNA-binding XRE family transcriptional regulator